MRALLGMLAMLVHMFAWRLLRRTPLRRRIERGLWGALLRGFAVDVHVHGAPAPGAVLHVANHVSWSDIAVLGRVLDAGFIAKSEVASWPLIGAGAAAYRCLFIERASRSATAGVAQAIAARLAGGESLILFAEGTTSPGADVLPFRSSLFPAEARIQPITLLYRHRDGRAFTSVERRAFAWVDDDELLPHAVALARAGPFRVDVHFEAPIGAADRKQAALLAREPIARRVQAATENLAA